MRQRDDKGRNELNPYLRKIYDTLIEKNITPTHLSTMAGLGSSTLSNLLKRNNIPTISTLDKICAVLGVSLSSFILDIEREYPEMQEKMREGVARYDPLLKRKTQIVEDWSALPVSDRNDTIKRMLDVFGSLEKDADK